MSATGTAAATSSILPVYARADLAFERGEGAWLVTADGRRFLDFGGGIAVNALGHAHPHLVAALTEQAARVWHISNLYQNPDGERLAKRLTEATFADLVFFSNSGAEALEASIKMARKYHSANGQPERFGIITFEGAFHGRTLATIAAGGQKKYLEGFGPKVEGFDQVPFGDDEALKAAIGPETGAILIEPVQGEGGIRPVPTERLRALRQLCDERGLLLIFDEVQTGVGRTGKLFAHEWAGISPDIMAVAKGIGGGFPMGACLATEKAAAGMTVGTHGSTYGGNPLACAAGQAVLDVVAEPEFLERVTRMGERLRGALEQMIPNHDQLFESVRGLGLMLGVKMKTDSRAFVGHLREHGLLTVAAGDNVMRVLPPLIIDEAHITEFVERLSDAARAYEVPQAA
ncbi:MAG TPA: aspartate aminotransferase family protein [Allosphingosinicella sp.]